MYATVEDLRNEGVTEAMVSDERLTSLLLEAGAFVDHVTGWFFEPRPMILRLSGRGSPSMEPPYPPIRVDWMTVDGVPTFVNPNYFEVVGAPVEPGFVAPRLVLLGGYVFPKGNGNIVISGLWGYTEPDGTEVGRTPLAIRRATMLLVLRNLPRLGEGDAASAKSAWRILEERTRDQSYKLAPVSSSSTVFTGDPEIDLTLAMFRCPIQFGAA